MKFKVKAINKALIFIGPCKINYNNRIKKYQSLIKTKLSTPMAIYIVKLLKRNLSLLISRVI